MIGIKTPPLSTQHLIGIKQLTKEDIVSILDTAGRFKEQMSGLIKSFPTLKHYSVANLFFENSTRTKLSFELAEKRLSTEIINFSSSSSSVKKGESLLDTVENILAMNIDMVVIRHPHVGAAQFLAEHTNAQIINAGDGSHEHPTQALLDAFSLREALGDLEGKHIGIVGDISHSRVALSNILCLQKLGAKITICSPQSLVPKHITSIGVEYTNALDTLLPEVDALMMLRIQMERQHASYFPSVEDYALGYQLNARRLQSMKSSAVVLHPGPINRGIEITSDVADGDRAIILQQVENGVATRMSVLFKLFQNSNKAKGISL